MRTRLPDFTTRARPALRRAQRLHRGEVMARPARRKPEAMEAELMELRTRLATAEAALEYHRALEAQWLGHTTGGQS